jgi:hypothetical protein
MGNVDCSKLQSGTEAEIEASARYCLEHGPVDGTGYVFCSSNCIFEGVPLASYRRMLQVRDEWYAPHGPAVVAHQTGRNGAGNELPRNGHKTDSGPGA